jgi:hypothetical protein
MQILHGGEVECKPGDGGGWACNLPVHKEPHLALVQWVEHDPGAVRRTWHHVVGHFGSGKVLGQGRKKEGPHPQAKK